MSQIVVTVSRDTIGPSVPGTVIATAISGSRIDLAWTASTDAGGSGLKGYNVYRNGALVVSQLIAPSFSDIGLASSTSYAYRVSAVDNAGNESGQSAIAQATTLDVTAPSVPSGLSASSISSTQIRLSWSASSDSGGSGLAGYRVYRDGAFVQLAASSPFTDSSLAPSTVYAYRVSAIDFANNESAQSAAATATTQSAAATGAPLLLATDIVAGPTSGGEGGKGAYVSIFGVNLGAQAALGTTTKVYFGTGGVWNEVDNYRALVPARGNPFLGAQELIVQLGSLGGVANGTLLNIKVNVGALESNTDLAFRVNPGDFWFVDNVSGDDATGIKNDITHPYRYFQRATGSTFTGVWAANNLKAGDFIIARAHAGVPWTDQVGFDTRLLRFRTQSGSHPTGVSGTGHITVQRYPGPVLGHAPEDVYIKLPAGSRGGFMGCGTANASAGGGKYFVLSGLRIEGASNSATTDAGPINLQSSADNWRIVNCDSSFPSADTGSAHQRNGAIAGNGIGVKVLFCYLHDVYGDTSQENHGVYFDGSNDTAQNCEVAYNWIRNVTHGSLIQFYATSGTTFRNMLVHSNVLDGGGKYGMNFADGTESVDFYNNIVMNTTNYGLRFNTFASPPSTSAIRVVHNVFYNCKTGSTGYNSMVANEWNGLVGVQLTHNIFAMQVGRASASTAWINGNTTGMTVSRNLYYDYQGSITEKYSGDATGMYGNPLFTSPGGDFSLGSASPAVDAATAGIPVSVLRDLVARSRPQGGASDIGPLER